MKYHILAMLLLTLLSKPVLSSCKPLIIHQADKINDSAVTVEGRVSRPNTQVSIEVYRGTNFIGKGNAFSNSNGNYFSKIRTHKPAGMRPDIKVYCR